MDEATATIPSLDSLSCFKCTRIYVYSVYLQCFFIFIFGSFFVFVLFLLCYTAFSFYPDILLLTRYQMEQMSKSVCYIVTVTNGDNEHIFKLVIIIEVLFQTRYLALRI